MPIRFFCKCCNQMIQIGAQRAGQTVVCPQCGERLTVPAQSVAQAEMLYQFLKRKRITEKTEKAEKTAERIAKKTRTTSLQQQPAGLPVPVQERGNAETDEEPNFSLEELDHEDVDRWIKEFWTTQPKGNEIVTDQPFTAEPAESARSIPENREIEAMTFRQHQTWLLFRTWLFIVFLLGFVGGFSICLFVTDFRKGDSESNGSARAVPSSENLVTGKLFYRGIDGERIPDADAVVLFLPLDRIPTFPISGVGLRPGDSHLLSTGDSVQQIEEMGGMFQRTNADGTFSFQYKNKGRYLALMISSHSKRSDSEPDTATLRELQRFFRNPKELLDNYRFNREEYELEQGKYMIRQTF
ncbi:MAG: hypothetical protein LBQ50_06625 [Planctomycetaceae bacterium]|nr:hypothetical protein [Planctomycetaceae bacterium]